MTNHKMRTAIYPLLGLALTAMLNSATANAQTAQDNDGSEVTVNALFEYPVAPDDVAGIEAKSEWLLQHFWDQLDVKNKNAVNQAALDHAFSVYAAPMRWAGKEAIEKSVDNLLNSIKGNPTLMIQMTKAAEENLYGPRAEVWIDDVYLRFIDAMLKNKKVKDDRKSRYRYQRQKLENTLIGSSAPAFSFTKPDGTTGSYEPTGNYTLIEFGDPDCYECRMTRLKLESNITVADMVRTGKLNICFFIPSPEEGWQSLVTDYPENWIVGAAPDADEIYDLRSTPSLYLIGPDRKIVSKNIDLDTAIYLMTKAD